MPYTTKWTNRGVVWTYSGILTGAELIQSNIEIFGDPRFQELKYQIVDLCGVTDFRVMKSHMKALADLDASAAKENPDIRVAVISHEPTGESMNRSYTEQVSETHWETRVFRYFDEGYAWAIEGGV